ncbi:MAG: hypothetical protein QM708_08550 [Propioniciclava sp.]|uniref:hypothetical protein n=1 Tax=Propioniciclava sp. TaxID=2038686 RepID=UPI0039E4690B
MNLEPPPGSPTVTVRTRTGDGSLSEPVGSAQVIAPDTVVVRGVGVLRLPLVVSAQTSQHAPVAEIDVVAVHLPESSPGGEESAGPWVALELTHPLPIPVPETSLGVAESQPPEISPWCVLFPFLPACRTAR